MPTRLSVLILAIGLKVTVGLSWVAAAADPVFVITPSRANGTWRFDDPARAIVHEPFVAGVPAMLDQLTVTLPHAAQGFRLFFSAQPFAGYTHTLVRRRTESQGTWYESEQFHTEGWLCPVLLKYFSTPPERLYLKAEPLKSGGGSDLSSPLAFKTPPSRPCRARP